MSEAKEIIWHLYTTMALNPEIGRAEAKKRLEELQEYINYLIKET